MIPDPPRALVAAEKARVRKLALARRDDLDAAAISQGSTAISAAVLALDLEPGCAVSAFLPILSEVDLADAIAGLDRRGHPVGLPIMVENAVSSVPGVKETKVEVVWEPPWDPSRMSDEARLVLNMW